MLVHLIRSRRAWALASALLWPCAVVGQPDSPVQVALGEESILFQDIPSVYAASKYEQNVSDAPASVTIITAEDIKRYGHRTLADILRSVRGFYVTNDRNYQYTGVRGFGRPGDYNTRILVLVDGHRNNDSAYHSATISTGFIVDVDLIDRVEVIRGPSSSLYGTSAFFGVVNVITKRGRDYRGTEIAAEAGSFDTRKGRVSYGNKYANGVEMLLSATGFRTDSQDRLYFPEFDDPSTNNGIADNADSNKYHSFFSKVSIHDLTVSLNTVSRRKQVPTGSFDTLFNDPRTLTVDNRVAFDVRYDHQINNDTELLTRVFYDTYEYHGDYVYDYPPITINKDFARADWWGTELQLTQQLGQRHKLITGTEYVDNFRQDQANFDHVPFFSYLDDKRESQNWAVYVQDEFRARDNLIFNIGVRHDDYDTFGGTTNPRLAVIYKPFSRTAIKLLYGEAFRAPNVYELYYGDDGFSHKGNPLLQPETIETYEAIVEHDIANDLRGIVSVYRYNTENLITLQTDPADGLTFFNNVDRVEANGVELALEGKVYRRVRGRVSYTHQKTEDSATGEILTNSPRNMAKINLTAPLVANHTSVGVETQYMSKRKTLANSSSNSFSVTNLMFTSQPWRTGPEFSLGFYNLFDKEYADPGSEEHTQDSTLR